MIEQTDGKRCIDRIEMVDEIEYDDVIKCDHVADKKCHTTFSTNYQSVQEEECQDTFKKNCVFEYEHVVKTTTFCSTTLNKDCDAPGCGFSEGEEECYDKTQEVVQKAPQEKCTIEPAITCKQVTKQVPKLGPTEECVLISKEVCAEQKINRRPIKKPVFRKWCYVPGKEKSSGKAKAPAKKV